MLNLKKGLAMVLAAVTALTFAPTVNFGTTVDAAAAPAPAVATPSGTVTKVNAISTATANTYDVYVKAGSTCDIVNGDTKVGNYKTSDQNYLWKAYTDSVARTEFTGATSLSDGISDVSYKAGKGLTITAAGQEDSTTAGTTIYLKPFNGSDGTTSSSVSPITVNVHVYKNTGSLTLGNGQTSVQKSVASNIASEIGLAESGSTYVLNKENRI